jgi:hypothetical protein
MATQICVAQVKSDAFLRRCRRIVNPRGPAFLRSLLGGKKRGGNWPMPRWASVVVDFAMAGQ